VEFGTPQEPRFLVQYGAILLVFWVDRPGDQVFHGEIIKVEHIIIIP
jgi:hypothetical protein